MPKKLILLFLLITASLSACGGPSEADLAVCDAYQSLVDAWPSDGDDIGANELATDIWTRVSVAAEDLLEAAEGAGIDELRQAALNAGDWADSYFEDNQDNAIGQGFIPFFNESHIPGGETISAQCEAIGSTITY
jgi:hypothetical protein